MEESVVGWEYVLPENRFLESREFEWQVVLLPVHFYLCLQSAALHPST